MKYRFWAWLAGCMPRRLVYACAMRIGVHATTGNYSWQDVPDLTFMEAMERWEHELP